MTTSGFPMSALNGFWIERDIVLGTPCDIEFKCDKALEPDTDRLRIGINCPSTGFATVRSIQVGCTELIIGGECDGFDFSPTQLSVWFDCPKDDGQLFRMRAKYTGWVPKGYKLGTSYTLILSVKEGKPS